MSRSTPTAGARRAHPVGGLNVRRPRCRRRRSSRGRGRRLLKQDGTVGTYAGISSTAMTASATNYLYLDLTSAGALTVNTTGFPTTAHVRLATVVAGGSTDHLDHRHPGRVQPVRDLFADGINISVGTATGTRSGRRRRRSSASSARRRSIQQTGGAATAGGTYTATEQGMLQKALQRAADLRAAELIGAAGSFRFRPVPLRSSRWTRSRSGCSSTTRPPTDSRLHAAAEHPLRADPVQEGPEPPTARFSYILDELAAGQRLALPSSSRSGRSTPTSNYVVTTDDRAGRAGPRCRTARPGSCSTVSPGSRRPTSRPATQHVTFTAVGVAIRCWDTADRRPGPAGRRRPDRTAPTSPDRPAVPVQPVRHRHAGDRRHPAQLHAGWVRRQPGRRRTRTRSSSIPRSIATPTRRTFWDLSKAVRYILATQNT